MEEEATQELFGLQFHGLRAPLGSVVCVTETDHAVTVEDEPGIGNGYPMGVAAEVLQHLLRAAPGRLGVDNPGATLQPPEERLPRSRLGQCGALAREVEPVLGSQPAQPGEVLAPEDWAQRCDRKQETMAARSPLRPISTQPPTRRHAVQVDMLRQGLPPSMEHGGDPELRSEMLRVTGKLLQGLDRGLKQQGVERPLVDANERIEEMRESEDNVEVGHGEQQGLL